MHQNSNSLLLVPHEILCYIIVIVHVTIHKSEPNGNAISVAIKCAQIEGAVSIIKNN